MEYLISFFVWIFYLFFQATSIYGGDSGELVAAAFTRGIAHPPGYPFYMGLGYLTSHIPWGTVAWRIGLLSSLPYALSLVFLGKTIIVLTKRRLLGPLVIVIAALLYPNWLYAIVPEVFGLYAFFSSVLVYLAARFIQTKGTKYLYWLSFVSDVSLTHHHMIIILIVVIAITCGRLVEGAIRTQSVRWGRMFIFFTLGFLLYLYAPIVSRSNPPFDWEHPASLGGFIRLVTRASYGSFRASYATGESVMDRILGIVTVAHFTLQDFGWLGVLGIGIGIVVVVMRFKSHYPLLLGYPAALLAFFFYAGFPVGSDFALGTLERFMVVLYQQYAILYGLGLYGALALVVGVWRRYRFHTELLGVVTGVVIVLGFLLPVRLFLTNYPRLIQIRDDRTMETLADDILRSVPNGAILSLDTDTSINAVAYAYYVLGKRRDMVFMSFPLLQYPVYRMQLKAQFPHLILPEDSVVPDETYLARFIKANGEKLPIASGKLIVDIPEIWVPRGLVMQYYPSGSVIPERKKILDENLALFAGFTDPSMSLRTRYHHLLLGDSIAIYDDRRLILAQALALQGRYAEAKDQIIRVMDDYPLTSRYYETIIKLLVGKDRCEDAKFILSYLKTKPLDADNSLPLFYQTYKTCEPESDQFRKYEEVYRANQSRFDTLLQ